MEKEVVLATGRGPRFWDNVGVGGGTGGSDVRSSLDCTPPTGILKRVLPSIGPVILISISYIDPGKWAAIIEGGVHFGSDLVVPMLIFNFVAIFCQYLSARIGLVTGKDLAQICNDEYDKWTCMFLGVQTMLSVIALDLTMWPA